MTTDAAALIPVERIRQAIVLLRGHKVMLDSDSAALYCVEVKALNQAVKRNLERFPSDFMFQLTDEEFKRVRLQSVTSNPGRGGSRRDPCVVVAHNAPPALQEVIDLGVVHQIGVFVDVHDYEFSDQLKQPLLFVVWA